MKNRIDWNKLSQHPGSENEVFEKFCYHLVSCKFRGYGSIGYYYNTPGSEFYLKLNKPLDYSGKTYNVGDIIGWQVKYWRGIKDDNNSPLGSEHINELINGFDVTTRNRSDIKLWIICSPGSFVQKNWDRLIFKLNNISKDCSFESWHKDVFEDFYINDPKTYNGLFRFFFETPYVGIEKVISISKDTLSYLESKFDIDLHIPSDFENTLLSIVNDKIAKKELKQRINSLYKRSTDQQKHPIINEKHWGYNCLTNTFKTTYIEDCTRRYNLIEWVHNYILNKDLSIDNIEEIERELLKYETERESRVEKIKEQISKILKAEPRYDYYVFDLWKEINSLEESLTGYRNESQLSLLDVVTLICKKDFSVFSPAGYGKTHFACSIAHEMIDHKLPVLLLTGSQFRHMNFTLKITEELGLHSDTTIDDIFDTLDFIGEIYSCKLPIIIDGLNESAPNAGRWKNELPPLRRRVRNRKHLILITTCREKEDYIRQIYGEFDYHNIVNPILLPGFDWKNLDYAIERYFRKYDIHPLNFSALKSFKDPLLLKIFCVTNKGKCNFLLNDHSLTSCMKKYSEQLINSIASESEENNSKTYRVIRHEISQGLNTIAQKIWNRDDRQLNYFEDFYPTFQEYSEPLLNEGLCFMQDIKNNEELIQFSYDMLAGYHIAKWIVSQCKTKKEFCKFIKSYYDKLFGLKRHCLSEDISKSLFYLIPEKYQAKYWFELMPTKEIVAASLDHMDIIFFSKEGQEAFKKLLVNISMDSSLKDMVCKSLFERSIVNFNLSFFSLFQDFFLSFKGMELDLYWNCLFFNLDTLEQIHCLIYDEYWFNKFDFEDKVIFTLMICGVTEKVYRNKFYSYLLYLVESNINEGLTILHQMIEMKDPFIFEIVVSAITGVGLRSQKKNVISKCIEILENYVQKNSTNHIVLLDNLETLFSYHEAMFSSDFRKKFHLRNKDEIWEQLNVDKFKIEKIYYDYDYIKYNLQPLYEKRLDKNPLFDKDVVYGMLYKRILDLGFNDEIYNKIITKENNVKSYRSKSRYTYPHKYGRHALMEFYGWLIINLKLNSTYEDTLRYHIIDIDPSSPRVSPMRSLVNESFMPKDLADLPRWVNTNGLKKICGFLHRKLPNVAGEWILLDACLHQRIKSKYAYYSFSVSTQLVSLDMNKSQLLNEQKRDPVEYYHAFAAELGWRNLRPVQEYDYDNNELDLVVKYCFSNWNDERFFYKNISFLNPLITRKIGLDLDVKELTYYYNGEKVSELYISESDQFFYLRKDIVDLILNKYKKKLLHNSFEFRHINFDFSDDTIELPVKQKWSEKKCLYETKEEQQLRSN